jgi:hypothetical protein
MASTVPFDTETWNRLTSIVAAAFRMNSAETAKLKNNKVAHLVGALPYLASCREPERRALIHLSTFVLGSCDSARLVFDHKKEDDYDVMARLAAIADFEGGDPSIIARGMKLLATVIISGYQRGAAEDKAAGRYNPLTSGAWRADERLAGLAADLATIPAADMDMVMTAEEARVLGWDD